MANAAEPQIVKDAVEAAEWMAKALSSSGYKADFTLDSLKEVDRSVDDQARGGKSDAGRSPFRPSGYAYFRAWRLRW
jgi:hypothetical protein